MSIEPKRLIPDYLPDPNAPAIQLVRTRQMTDADHEADRRQRWERSSIVELIKESEMPHVRANVYLASDIGVAIREKETRAARHGSAAE